ncbi:MAG: phage head morphogenesis protein [Ruminococcus sp.]|nr:phage head morphogenesis protein [Ruminococcus sp.]
MYIKKAQGYVIKRKESVLTKDLLSGILSLFLDENVHFLNWVAIPDEKLCVNCSEMNGKVYDRNEIIFPFPPLHLHCRCTIQPIKTVEAGKATSKGNNGADWWLKNNGELPDYYITFREALKLGFRPKKGNLGKIAPGKMLTKEQYFNRNGHLPERPGRIWYEADINYSGGFRNEQRILYSNDGLLFVTFDHYRTFIEII